MVRLCVVFFIIVFVISSEQSEDEQEFASSVLKKNETNYLYFAGKKYYFQIVFKTNFYRATRFCRQQGMQLVSIRHQAENDKLWEHVAKIGAHGAYQFLTSGTNLGNDDQYVWLSSGENVIYTNWAKHEPSLINWEKAPENCIVLRYGTRTFKWNDINCLKYETYFICESYGNC